MAEAVFHPLHPAYTFAVKPATLTARPSPVGTRHGQSSKDLLLPQRCGRTAPACSRAGYLIQRPQLPQPL